MLAQSSVRRALGAGSNGLRGSLASALAADARVSLSSSSSRATISSAASSSGLRVRAAPMRAHGEGAVREFGSAGVQRRAAGEDPGGKPNDGRYPTVYDDFYNITSAPPGDGSDGLVHGAGAVQIASMDDKSFTLDDGLVLSCPILLISGGGGGGGPAGGSGSGVTVLMWDAPALEGMVLPNGKGWERWVEEQERVWKALEVVHPRPEILIFGTGSTVLPLPVGIKQYLNAMGMQVDVQSTRAACSTYNLLIEEGRRVGAALLPNIRQPMPRGG